ncbi:MAG: universal stress protein [Puniceicoccales bacterium]|jgi:nucleotide-binding universal stress UspA family protein|nr:universal stress protein [Puniceicoccales bacterium]
MKKLLACIDGSLYGQTCAQYALWFAKKTGAQTAALYVSELWQYEAPLVADFGGSLGAQPYMGLTAQLRQVEADKATMLKEYLVRAFAQADLAEHLAFFHRTGMLVDCIGEFESGDTPAELLIVGKRGEAWNMAKDHLGSNMERVARATALPCFVANREFFEPQKLLFAIDGSASAAKAIAWYGANKTAFGDAELHVVSVAAKPAAAEKTAEVLREAAAAFEAFGTGCKPVFRALAGVPADAISAYQQETGANLLLMGAYGHSRIRRLFIGSTTVELIQRNRVPVVLFR